MSSLISLAVELTKTANIQDLGFSQAFENIYVTLETLKKEEDGKTEVILSAPTVIGKKKSKPRRITCAICGQKLRSLAGKHLRKHGITVKEYRNLAVQVLKPSGGNGAASAKV